MIPEANARRRIALASERPPKIHAVQAVIDRLAGLDARWQNVELLARSVASGVRDTPLDDAELRSGARQRALNLAAQLQAEGAQAWLYVGLEGGVHVEPGRAWLRSWAYARDGAREAWGCGPSVELPASISQRVVAGEDLARVIDAVAGGVDLRSRGGTWGFVTRDVLSRAVAFEMALLAALAPFYNAPIYAPGAPVTP